MTETSNIETDFERSLLFGVISVQLRYISSEQLSRASDIWSRDPNTSLPDVIVEQGLLTDEKRDEIMELVEKRIGEHGGNPGATLASFGGEMAVHESFAASVAVSRAADDSILVSFGGEYSPTVAREEKPDPQAEEEVEVDRGEVSSKGRPEKADDMGRTKAAPSPPVETFGKVTVEHPSRYTIKDEYGRGGIGRVMLAYDSHIGREVAVKELLAAASAGSPATSPGTSGIRPETMARFIREARITGQLEHPGIVPVYELGKRPDGSVYYTMKLVKGETLYDRLKKAEGLPGRLRLMNHFLDLCQAMAYAHTKEVIHRDIKPQNVMVGEFGETVVLDWGLAKVRGLADERAVDIEEGLRLLKEESAGKTIEGSALGTPAYMSPEQAEGDIEKIDEKSDVWSLGAVLYEILTGSPPYTGVSAYEVMGKVMKDPVVPVKEAEPDAPAELAAICEKCLTKDREQRYDNAAELAEDVSRFMAGGLVSAYEYTLGTLIKRWLKKRWPIVTTVAAAVVALAILGVFSYVRIMEERNVAIEQRELAQQREREARLNLAEAYLQYGIRAERESRWKAARLYFAKSLELGGGMGARSGLYRGSMRTIDPVLAGDTTAHVNGVFSAAISPGADLAATGGCAVMDEVCKRGEIKVWSMPGLETVLRMEGHDNSVSALAFTPDGKRLVSGGWDGRLIMWDLETGDTVRSYRRMSGWVSTVTISPGGEYLLAGSDSGEAKAWDLETGSAVMDFSGHAGGFIAMDVSTDGKHAVTAGEDGIIILWSMETGTDDWVFGGHDGWVRAVDISDDGDLVISGGRDNTVRVWSVRTGDMLSVLEGHADDVTFVRFMPDGDYAVSAGEDGRVIVWDIGAEKMDASFMSHKDKVTAAALAKSGGKMATGSSSGQLRLWDLGAGSGERRFKAHEGEAAAVVEAGRDKAVTAGYDHLIKVWDLNAGEKTMTLSGHQSFVRDVDVAEDVGLIASSSWDGTVRLWDLATGEEIIVMKGHDGNVASVDLSEDGRRAVTGGDDDTVRLWATDTGEELKKFIGHTNNVSAAAFLPGDRMASVSWDGTLRIWEGTGTEFSRRDLFKKGGACLAVSTDGSLIAAGGFFGKLVLIEPETGKVKNEISAHDGPLNAVTFSPDGDFIITGGREGIKVWKSGDLSGVLSYGNGFEVKGLDVTEDGQGILISTADGDLIVLPLDNELMTASGDELLQKAQEETGLTLSGFELVARGAGE